MYCKRDKPLIFNPVKIIAKNGKENINFPPIANNVAKNDARILKTSTTMLHRFVRISEFHRDPCYGDSMRFIESCKI